jgi:enoyl-CoA hydratase/carnithine racemase
MGRSPLLVPYLLAGIPFPAHLIAAHITTEIVPSEKVMEAALKWATLISECSPEAVWVSKDQVSLPPFSVVDMKGKERLTNEGGFLNRSIYGN